MDIVGDKLAVGITVQSRAHRTGVSVVEGRHGIKKMCEQIRPVLYCGPSLIIGGIGVPNGGNYVVAAALFDKVGGGRGLGGESHNLDDFPEGGDFYELQVTNMGNVVGTCGERANKRALEVGA